MTDLVAAINKYAQRICDIDAGALGMKQERANALDATKTLLETISEVTGVLGVTEYQIGNGANSISRRSGGSAMTMQHLVSKWEEFYVAIGEKLGVTISPETGEPIEEREIKDCRVSHT